MKVCSVDNCGRPLVARGLCSGHYQRLRHGGLRPDVPLGSMRNRQGERVIDWLPPTLSYRQLDYWIRCGLFTPRNTEARPGSGRSRRFDLDERQILCRVSRIVALGVLPETAFRLARGEQVDGLQYQEAATA